MEPLQKDDGYHREKQEVSPLETISTMPLESYNWAHLIFSRDGNLILLTPGHPISTFQSGNHRHLLDIRQTNNHPFRKHVRIIKKQLQIVLSEHVFESENRFYRRYNMKITAHPAGLYLNFALFD